MAGSREDQRPKINIGGQTSFLPSSVSPDAIPSVADVSMSAGNSGAVPRIAQHDSGISSSGYMESSGLHSSQICPSDTHCVENIQREKIISSIYKTLDQQDRHAQRVVREKLDFIKKYYRKFPVYLKTGFFDAMILYSQTDFEAAETYKKHLNSLDMDSGREVKAVLYDDAELESLPGSKFQHLSEAFKRCTFVFVYLTKQFCESDWCQLSSEECLMESIYNPERKWCVVPVYTVQRSKADFRIPMGLNSLKGVNYYNNDDFYRRGLKKLIGDKLYIRERHEQDLLDEQYGYALKLQEEEYEKLRKNEQIIRQKSHSPEYKSHSHYGLQNQKSWPQSESYPAHSLGYCEEPQDEEIAENRSNQPYFPDHIASAQHSLESRFRNLHVTNFARFEPSLHPVSQPSMPQLPQQGSPIQYKGSLDQPAPTVFESTDESPSVTHRQTTSRLPSNVMHSSSGVNRRHDNMTPNTSTSPEPHSLSGASSITEDQYPSCNSEPQDKPSSTSSTNHDKSSNGQAEVVKIIEHHHYYHNNRKKVVNIVNAGNVVVGDKGQILSEYPITAVDSDLDNEDVTGEDDETKHKSEKSGEISLDDNSIDAGSTVMKADDLKDLTPRGSKNSTGGSDLTSTQSLQHPHPTSHEDNTSLQNIPVSKVGSVSGVQRQTSLSNNKETNSKGKTEDVPVVTPKKPKREVNFNTKNTSNKPVAVTKPIQTKHPSEDEDDNISGENTFLNDFSQTRRKALYSEDTAVKIVDNEETFVKQPNRASLNVDSSLETDCPVDEIETIKARNIAIDTTLYDPAVLTADDKQISAVEQLLAMDYKEGDIKFALETLRRARPGHVHFSINNMLDILEKKEAASSSVDPTSQGDCTVPVPVREYARQRSVSEENLHQNHEKPKTDFHKSDTDLDLTPQNRSSMSKHINREKCCIS